MGLAAGVIELAQKIQPKLDKAIENNPYSDDPEPQKACDAPLGRRGARDGA